MLGAGGWSPSSRENELDTMSTDTPVIDFHAHLGRWGRHGWYDDEDRYLRLMDQAGIDRACVNCIFYGDARRANDITAAWAARNPDRFIPVAFITPHYPEEAIPELERAFDILGMKFLKIYPDYFGRPNDDPAYFPIYEWLNERGLAVMGHATYPFDPEGTTVPDRFAALSERFPRVKWVLAHSGSSGASRAGEAAHDLPNVYLETCGSGTSYPGVEATLEAVGGDDKVLFGTDVPLHDPRQQLAKVATAAVPEESKRKILGLNAIKLLGL